MVKGVTVIGLPKTAIIHYWGARVAQTLIHHWNIVRKVDFHLVYWEGMDKVMKYFPEVFRVWVTKQVSHFNGTNHQLAQIAPRQSRTSVLAVDVGMSPQVT
jgi:hypothetical protein